MNASPPPGGQSWIEAIRNSVAVFLVATVSLLTVVIQPVGAFNMGLSPAKVQEKLLPGQEKTIVYSFLNVSTTENLRIQVLVNDWTVNEKGDVVTPKTGA